MGTGVCRGSNRNSSGAKQEAEQQQIKQCSGAVKTWMVGSYISWMVFS